MRSSVLSAFRPEDLDAWVADVVAAGERMGAMDRLFAQVLADVARRRWSMSTTLSLSHFPPEFISAGGVVGTPRSHVGRARKSTIAASFKGYAAVNEDAVQPEVFDHDVIVKTNDERILRGRRIHQ